MDHFLETYIIKWMQEEIKSVKIPITIIEIKAAV